MTELHDICARELIDTTPKIMQTIRVEMRHGRGTELSIPQFRTMRFIQRNPDSSLSELADYLGLTLPSASKMVDSLTKQELVTRHASPTDRRRLTLSLTANGEAIINAARSGTQASLVQKLESLSADELQTIHQAMQILLPIFVNQDS